MSHVPGPQFPRWAQLWGNESIWGVGVVPSHPFSPCGSAPDFVVLDDTLRVQATYISGELVWQAEEARL